MFWSSTRPRWGRSTVVKAHMKEAANRGGPARRLQSAHFVSTVTFSVQLHKAQGDLPTPSIGPGSISPLNKSVGGCRQRRGLSKSALERITDSSQISHFLMKTLPKVATEMALHVLAYNLTRVMNIVGIKPLLAAILA
jgi:hypothetical protein